MSDSETRGHLRFDSTLDHIALYLHFCLRRDGALLSDQGVARLGARGLWTRETRIVYTASSLKVYLMATNGCARVTFFQTFRNAFYFQVATATDVDEDSFKCFQSPKDYLVRSMDNKFLLLNAEGHFQVQNLNSDQLSHPDCKVKIQTYIESSGENGRGKPAMLYVEMNNKNIVVCCSGTQNHDIYPEEMSVLPKHIENPTHKALFYMKQCTASKTFTFESSEHKSEFLGFEPTDDPSVNKLVLHRKVESCSMFTTVN
ncbi:uncharacterized protein LOC144515769 [Sander vitreus]